jgi:branched-chain amino acid transport system ATP-binding protein
MSANGAGPLLAVDEVSSGYGLAPVLERVSLHVDRGEVVAVVGANGVGKTTLLRTVSGLIPSTSGRIAFDGETISGAPAHDIVRRGIAMVPEGGRLFPFMTVLENLELGAFTPTPRARMPQTLDEVMELFPILRERRKQFAGLLSGGERTMCAVARALMSRPKLLMLDEPSLGLSPVMVEKVFDMIRSVVASRNLTVLLIEQNVADALEMANRAYVIERGRIVKTGAGRALASDPDIQRAYMGL